MNRKLLIRDLTLRDGQQSLFATRMTQSQIDRVLPLFKESNFYAMEVWGGAIPDSVMRYLNEDPWERLEKIKAGIGNTTKLTALSRGRNVFGYNPYTDEVIEGFNKLAISSGIDIMRIFDALNDLNNLKSTIKVVKANGGIADCAVCYTVDPKINLINKINAVVHGKNPYHEIFTIEYFVRKALELEKMGADIISIKDMAGLVNPTKAGQIIKKLKKEVKVPIDFHTHCTPGYGLAATLKAIVNGVDIVDTSIMNFGGGSAAPAFELIQIFADKLGLDTGVNLSAVVYANKILKDIRIELAQFDNTKLFPIDFDITKDKLPKKINSLFDQAIEYANADKDEELLKTTWEIEKYFNFPEPNIEVKKAEIPGGMYSNMLAQLKQLKLDHLLPEVLELVPTVRMSCGCPPLVTPTSQIVGAEAVNCVIDKSKGLPYYTNNTLQFINLVKGQYGKTPIKVDPKFREKIAGVAKETPFDLSKYKKQDNPVFKEFGNVKLAQNEKEELLLELFPAVASTFLKNRIEKNFREEQHRKEEEQIKKQAAILKQNSEELKKYSLLSEEEKSQRIIDALDNDDWAAHW
ncbi:MAG: carboxylase [Bacteroidota bacterium]|nr:carboxylase [Bacteroidota bacterium]